MIHLLARIIREEYDDEFNFSLPIVYKTTDLSPVGLLEIYRQLDDRVQGKTAIKLSTAELRNRNILPRSYIKELYSVIPNSAIVECNTAYKGTRFETSSHIDTARRNGFDFCKLDIMDASGEIDLPINKGKKLKSIPVGRNLMKYDSMVVYTHFKGHSFAGFGGALKNIGIGCASKRGKEIIHGNWKPDKRFIERMADSGKGITDRFRNHIIYINVLQNISVDCDCVADAVPPTCPNICILGSTDILAIDQASVDMIYALPENQTKDIRQRIESRNGLYQLDCMEKLKMGYRNYTLVSIDQEESQGFADYR